MDTDPIPDIEYMKRSILGGRQYCLKEPLTTLPKARRQMKLYVYRRCSDLTKLKLNGIPFIFSLWTLDLVAKFFLYAFLLWAFLKVTGLRTYVDSFFTESQGFLKEA